MQIKSQATAFWLKVQYFKMIFFQTFQIGGITKFGDVSVKKLLEIKKSFWKVILNCR